MVRVRRSSGSTSASWTSFESDQTAYENLYEEYELITRSNPGWSLKEIRDLAVRERNYWLSIAITRGVRPKEWAHG